MSDYTLDDVEEGFNAVRWALNAQIEKLFNLRAAGKEFQDTADELQNVIQDLDRISSELYVRRQIENYQQERAIYDPARMQGEVNWLSNRVEVLETSDTVKLLEQRIVDLELMLERFLDKQPEKSDG